MNEDLLLLLSESAHRSQAPGASTLLRAYPLRRLIFPELLCLQIRGHIRPLVNALAHQGDENV